MRLTEKSVFEKELFLNWSVLIFPNAFKPERERMCYKSEHVAWWCVVRHFALLRQKKPVCVISCEQESVPCGERWFRLEKNCSGLCKRLLFRQEVSEFINSYQKIQNIKCPWGLPAGCLLIDWYRKSYTVNHIWSIGHKCPDKGKTIDMLKLNYTLTSNVSGHAIFPLFK